MRGLWLIGALLLFAGGCGSDEVASSTSDQATDTALSDALAEGPRTALDASESSDTAAADNPEPGPEVQDEAIDASESEPDASNDGDAESDDSAGDASDGDASDDDASDDDVESDGSTGDASTGDASTGDASNDGDAESDDSAGDASNDGDAESDDSAGDASNDGDAESDGSTGDASNDGDASDGDASDGDVESEDSTPTYPKLPETLREQIVTQMAEAQVPGLSACILKDQTIFWCDGFGTANLALDVPVTQHTPFLLASVSKLFTSTVILQLVEDGLIDLDVDISVAIGWDLAHPSSQAPVTMQQLLTHYGGIRDNWSAMGDFYAYGVDPALSLQEVVEGYFQPAGAWYDAQANFSEEGPGESFQYSNMGVALAAYVVEKVTGQDFAERCHQTLFGPLGLTQTAWRLASFSDLDVLAMPYVLEQGQYAPVGHYTFADYPNGGLRASAYDLARFVVAHLQGGSLNGVQILAPETVAEIFTEQASRPAGPQGWMWYQSTWSGENWWGHGGAEKGVWTETFFRESDTMGFVVLTNGDANNPYPLYDIEDALLLWAESLEDAEL